MTLGQLRLVVEPAHELVHLERGRGNAGSTCQVRRERLVGIGVVLLRQIAHGKIGG